MKRTLILTSALCVALLAATGSAQPAPSGKPVDKLAAATCAKERKAIGRKAFTKKYGERSMPSCIRRTRPKVRAAQRQAVQDCNDELAEYGPVEFAEDYGSDESGSDAMANCIAETVDWLLAPEDDSGEEEEEDA
jgi:hypothetical protein